MKKGITLLEILVTALILSMALASMMYSFVVAKRINIRNSHIHNATQIISQTFEDIQRQENSVVLDLYLTDRNLFENANGIPIIRKSSYSLDDFEYTLTVLETGIVNVTPTTSLRMFEATVRWSDSNNDLVSMRILSNEPNL